MQLNHRGGKLDLTPASCYHPNEWPDLLVEHEANPDLACLYGME